MHELIPKGVIISALRRLYRWYGIPAKEAMKQAKIKGKDKYLCNECKKYFSKKTMKRDHREPIVPVTGWDSWDGFIERLFTGSIDILCKKDHDKKTKQENSQRKQNRSKNPAR